MEPSEEKLSASRRREGRRRGRIACRQCRQAKLRCGLDQIPCSRCKQGGLHCTVDPSYKRSNKYEKVQELEDQVLRLRNQVDQRHEQQSVPSLTSRSSPSAETPSHQTPSHHFSNIGDGHSVHVTSATTISPFGESPESTGIQRLGSVTIDQLQTEELFSIYFKEYHYLLPMLEPNRPAGEYYSSSPLLFWSIIAVAARQYRKDIELLDRISQPLNDLLWRKAAESPGTLGNIQALILVSKWPFLNLRLRNDRSIILTSVAVTAAMQVGMHRPGRENDYSKDQIDLNLAARAEWTRTWLSAVILSQMYVD